MTFTTTQRFVEIHKKYHTQFNAVSSTIALMFILDHVDEYDAVKFGKSCIAFIFVRTKVDSKQ